MPQRPEKKEPVQLRGKIPEEAYREVVKLLGQPDKGEKPRGSLRRATSKAWEIASKIKGGYSAEFIAYFMKSSRSEVELFNKTEVPRDWQDALVKTFGQKPRAIKNIGDAYKGPLSKVPELQTSLGHFDLYIDKPKRDTVRYTIVDRYEFPDRATKATDKIKVGQQLEHNPKMEVTPFRGKSFEYALRAAAAQTTFERRDFKSRNPREKQFEPIEFKSGEPTTDGKVKGQMMLPQRYLEDFGTDFVTVLVFERKIDAKGPAPSRPEKARR